MFHELNFTDACLFPEEEDIIKALKEEWSVQEDEISSEIDGNFLDIHDIIRGRRNRRGTYVRESLKKLASENPNYQLEQEGM